LRKVISRFAALPALSAPEESHVPEDHEIEILIIEDNPDDALLIQHALKQTGWRFEFVETGAEGVKRASEKEYDAVVLDYLLNDMTGTEVLLRIREKRSNVPVIMASGAGSHFIVARALALGANEFVNKDDDEFGAKLQKAVERFRDDPNIGTHPAKVASSVKERAREIKKIIATLMQSSDLVASVGIVGPDGALIHSAIQEESGAQDVTAVLAGTVQMMLSTVANHLGFGSARSFVASFDRGSVAMTPLSGGLVLFITTGQGPDRIDRVRREIETAAMELNNFLRSGQSSE
jgi:CheY-like chemotaxis protein/predicted regulator of Ras-like GTPase activity (Roadblock/LC7/MglB family)